MALLAPRLPITVGAVRKTRSYLLTVGDSGRFRAHIWTGSGTLRYFDGSTGIQLNTWYHVAMTYDGSYLRLYVNGAPDGSTLASGNICVIADPLRIGGSYSGGWGNYKLHGQIDEPTLYHRALTPSEISAIYMAGRRQVQERLPKRYRRRRDGGRMGDEALWRIAARRLL